MNGVFDGFSSISDATSSLTSLSQLLSGPSPESNQKPSTTRAHPTNALTPASIGPAKKPVTSTTASSQLEKKKQVTKDIWDDQEVLEDNADIDPRPTPEYNISYRQKVTSEDMFLGMAGKMPSIGHCDELVVSVELPDTNLKDIELSVDENVLDLRSTRFRLKTPLPTKVNDKKGSAKWDPAKHTITITLPIVPEFPL